MKKKPQKSLGQVGYEKNKLGGIATFGPWAKAPQCVRDSHENLARIIEREITRRRKQEHEQAMKRLSGYLDSIPSNTPRWAFKA